MTLTHRWLCFVALVLGTSACSTNESKQPTTNQLEIASSPHPDLQWKRYAAFEADIAQALELPAAELCTEFGVESCINSVHLAPLGGNEPFETGLLEASAEPLATTATVVDRVLLSACGRRTELDRAAGPKAAKLYRELDLDSPAPSAQDKRVQGTIQELYRRFLARDPDSQESALVAKLTSDDQELPVPASEFATLACFTIGSSSEFLFF